MKISEELKKAGLNVIEAINEVEVESLGLLGNSMEIHTGSFLEKEDYLKDVGKNVKVIITTDALKECVLKLNLGVCVVEKPRLSFFLLHNYLVESAKKGYVLETKENRYGMACKISKNAQIANHNVVIGNRVIIEDNVIIYENTEIEDDVIIHAGSVIGGEGFECKNDGERIFTVKHAGKVKIKRGSEIRYNSCIDKALYAWDTTIISEYSVLDNLVHIGHGVKIGARNMIAAGSVIAGRTVTGNDTWIGAGCTICNGLIIGEHCKIDIGSVVIKDVKNNCEVFGNPAKVIRL